MLRLDRGSTSLSGKVRDPDCLLKPGMLSFLCLDLNLKEKSIKSLYRPCIAHLYIGTPVHRAFPTALRLSLGVQTISTLS